MHDDWTKWKLGVYVWVMFMDFDRTTSRNFKRPVQIIHYELGRRS